MRRLILGGGVLVVVAIGGACAVYAMMKEPANVPGVPRDSVALDDTHTISYLHAGDADAPRIIYVHGSPGSATAWARYLSDPIPGYESIAIDRLGFGQTKPEKPVPSLKEQAHAIEPFLVQRKGQWPILVGHSFGATIICEAAADFPGKVGGLVILAGAFSPELENVQWYQHLAEFWFVPSLLPAELTNSNRELLPLKGELQELAKRLGEIKCPVAIVHGQEDMLVPVANVSYLEQELAADAVHTVTIIPDENHFLPWTVEPTVRKSIVNLAADMTKHS